MATKTQSQWIRNIIAKAPLDSLSDELKEKFEHAVERAKQKGFRVDGMLVAEAFLNKDNFSRIQSLVLNDEALTHFKKDKKITRIEFIVEGPLPRGLLTEPELKTRALFKQVIGYELCKACRLCIEVCPKDVYTDDGLGKPAQDNRRSEECPGGTQCGKCVDICPEKTIQLDFIDPSFVTTLFVLLENPLTGEKETNSKKDFFLENPLETGKPLFIRGALQCQDIAASLQVLDASGFYPVFESEGIQKHFVDSEEPEAALEIWAMENYRSPHLAFSALRVLLSELSQITGTKEGKYDLKKLLEGIMDDILLTDVDAGTAEGKQRLKNIIEGSRMKEIFFGAKRRPVGGILPPGTSPAWKTPYGDEIPKYVHLEHCLGPECALCVTNCPEGGGGDISAIKMVPLAPLSCIPFMMRGLGVFLLKLDGTHNRYEDVEDFTGKTPVDFIVNPDYCKACGMCIAYCPYGVIEPAERIFDLRG